MNHHYEASPEACPQCGSYDCHDWDCSNAEVRPIHRRRSGPIYGRRVA